MEATEGERAPRLTVLADRLDYFTEDDLTLLAAVTLSTAEQWRKRREGPAYVRIGKRVMYPRIAVLEWMAHRVRQRKLDPKSLFLKTASWHPPAAAADNGSQPLYPKELSGGTPPKAEAKP
jgi:hypothetical protein